MGQLVHQNHMNPVLLALKTFNPTSCTQSFARSIWVRLFFQPNVVHCMTQAPSPPPEVGLAMVSSSGSWSYSYPSLLWCKHAHISSALMDSVHETPCSCIECWRTTPKVLRDLLWVQVWSQGVHLHCNASGFVWTQPKLTLDLDFTSNSDQVGTCERQ